MRPALLSLVLAGCSTDGSFARAYQIEALDEAIGGPKGLTRTGDFVLENDAIRVGILGARPSMGPHTSGGSLADADLQHHDPRYSAGFGNDQLAETFPTVNLNITRVHDDASHVEITSDGSDGGPAVVCITGPAEPFLALLGGLWSLVGAPDFQTRTDYTLAPGSSVVQMRTWAVFREAPVTCDEDIDSRQADTSDDELALLDLALGPADPEDTGVTCDDDAYTCAGAVLGDFYLQGGSVDVFTPEVGFDEGSYIFDLQQASLNTFQEPIPVDFLAGTAGGVSYGLMPAEGRLFIPMFTSSQTIAVGAGVEGDGSRGRFEDGAAFHYDRWFSVGRGDVGSALDPLLEARGIATGRVEGFVVERGTGTPLSDVHVFAYKAGAAAPYTEWTTDVGDDPHPDGSFSGTLPEGDWEILVHAAGRPNPARVPVTVSSGTTTSLVLESPRPGTLTFSVVDETGLQVPAKLTVFAEGDSPRDSVLGDGYIAGEPAAVYFTARGEGEIALPPGTYTAIASRGIEYEIDVSEPFTVRRDSTTDLDLQVVHSVDTTGWVSADLHVHSSPSHDSGVSLEARATTMVAEGVEFFASTDHDTITDFRPVVEALGLEHWVSTAVGLEVTTIEVGHFLGFPLMHDYLADAGGALDWTDLSPLEMLDGIRDLGVPGGTEPVVFVGHPRDGILGYFDQYGFDPYSGSPGTGGNPGSPTVDPGIMPLFNRLLDDQLFSTDFDGLELLNGKRRDFLRTPTQAELDAYVAAPDSISSYDFSTRTLDEQQDLIDGQYTLGFGENGQIDDWFTLLNLGFRFTALGNSDTHTETSIEAGCPRNFVLSDTDDAGFISDAAIAEAVRAGHVVASYGPFVRFSIDGDQNVPGTTVTGAGEHVLSIQVQSPSWFDVDRVELYENGTLIEEWDVPTPNDDIVNLDTQLSVQAAEDAWYVVIAQGNSDMAPVFTPVDIPPIQLDDVVTEALADVPGIGTVLTPATPIPQTYPVHPFAITNPVWVDVAGDGFDAPGLPDWLVQPADPPEGGARR